MCNVLCKLIANWVTLLRLKPHILVFSYTEFANPTFTCVVAVVYKIKLSIGNKSQKPQYLHAFLHTLLVKTVQTFWSEEHKHDPV